MKKSYFSGTIQPGQAGIARLEIQAPDETGPVEVRFEFATNDPEHPVITFTLGANVRPVPEFVQRLDSPDLANGERSGGLRLWPAAHPRIYLERGETLLFWLRVWIESPGSAPISVTTDKPGVIVHVGERPANSAETATAVPADAVTTTVRTDASGATYWLDVKAGPINKTGVFRAPLTIPDRFKELAEPGQTMPDVTLVVVESSIAISPAMVNLGTMSIGSLGSGPVQVGALNVRKLFGTFRVLSVRSSAPSLSFDVRTLVKDKNYLIRIQMDSGKAVKPSSVDSSILITTDDPKHLTLEVPLKMVLAP